METAGNDGIRKSELAIESNKIGILQNEDDNAIAIPETATKCADNLDLYASMEKVQNSNISRNAVFIDDGMDNFDEMISNAAHQVNTQDNFDQNLGDNVLGNDLLMDDIIQDMHQTPN